MKEVRYGKLEVIICTQATDVCALINERKAKLETVVLELIEGAPATSVL